VRWSPVLGQLLGSSADTGRVKLCQPDLTVPGTAHHVRVTEERHELTLATELTLFELTLATEITLFELTLAIEITL